ncbi:RNA-binding cell elongation regulator Jag/EloR [Desulfovibrio legallii]|jgi:spoIIIJ-associated protein|uniref:RNA-binding protein KhpB n=1 Tax=Desulfovibrio legallii TaxID=571438 RepID=A0A1G7MNY3_9BACT|nr:RNA-binding cell elongation regulator Jag/EloR [Desulfovibrio legallii]SDF63495.1 spoIIIJ-associated protein [Desulfovibrio legallii]
MEGFKEFQGKDLDDAIREACEYFNTAREKLEIEIVQDAKSGIFGIVGARKAKVRARRVELREAVASILGKNGAAAGRAPREAGRDAPREPRETAEAASRHGDKPAPRPGEAEPPAAAAPQARPAARPACRSAAQAPAAAAPEQTQDKIAAPVRPAPEGSDAPQPAPEGRRRRGVQPGKEACAAAESASGDGRAACQSRRRGQAAAAASRPAPAAGAAAEASASGESLEEDFADAGLPLTPLEQLDLARLEALAREAVGNLVRPIVGGEARIDVRVDDGRVFVGVDCDADPGLLIGREGQTLAALQYMVSRIVSRGMNAAVRVQLDAGAYRQRQEEKLREMALALAEKVRQTGRSLSTRPLSSYHRRVVHVCLQELSDVQTRSSGDGPLKRVVIMRRKGEKA